MGHPSTCFPTLSPESQLPQVDSKGGLILLSSTENLREELNRVLGFREIVGRSPALVKALELAIRVASRQTPILLVGETGTGKDLLARAIHEGSAGRDAGFTKIS